jgi:hypothetical protein
MAKTKRLASFWQTIGFTSLMGGSFLLIRLFALRGSVSTTSPMLGTEIASTSIMLMGFALFALGRIFNSVSSGYRRMESILWKTTGMIMLMAGMSAMVLQNAPAMGNFFHYIPSFDNLLLGVAGTSILTAGIGALLVDQLMQVLQPSPQQLS